MGHGGVVVPVVIVSQPVPRLSPALWDMVVCFMKCCTMTCVGARFRISVSSGFELNILLFLC